MKKNREQGYLLPDVIDPERIGVCVPVPLDDNHRRAFMDALYRLTWANNWQHDGTDKGLNVSKVWTEIYEIVSSRLGVEICEGGEPLCVEYPPTAGFIRYGPQDPRYQPDYVPPGYAFAPWYFATSISNTIYGSQDGDIICTFERMPAFVSFPPDVENEQYPSFTINLTGAGSVEVHLRNLGLGSIFWYVTDESPLIPVGVDVNKDVVQLPPETHDYNIVEFEWTEPGFHWMRFHLVPRFDIEEAPLAFGGGLIKVVVCGFGVDEGDSMDCCDELLQALEQLKVQGVSEANWQRKSVYDGEPDSIHINAPTITFNQQEAEPDETEQGYRDTGLCAAVTQYVYNRVAAAMYALAAGAGLGLGAGGALVVFGGPLGWVVGGIIAIISALTLDALEDAAEDSEALQNVICDLYSALDGITISQANFTSALNGLSGETANEQTIVTCLQAHPSALENWLYFLDLLGSGYDAAVGGAELDCICEEEANCVDMDFTVASYGAVVTHGAYVAGSGFHELEEPDTWFRVEAELTWEEACQPDNVHFELSADDGGTSGTYQWYRRNESGVWVYLFNVAVQSGSSGVYTQNLPLELGEQFTGIRIQGQRWPSKHFYWRKFSTS